jgi:CBS domain-containing protein
MPHRWKTVAELLGPRRETVHSIPADATVLAALERLDQHDIGVLVVLEGSRPAGILSERDLARKVELRGRSAKDTRVAEVMTPQILHVTPDQTVERCILMMKQHRVRHLVVIEEARAVGVLSIRDILEDAVAEEEKLIRDLEAERLRMTTDTGTY